MNRLEVISKLLQATQAKTYLEIGVRYGTIFLPVRAPRKLGVDPDFQIPWYKKLLYPVNFFHSRYFCMESDEFFSRFGGAFESKPIDVVFIDGLHTYEQSLRDVENCLKHLSPRGVIVMHDCNPPSAAAALLSMDDSLKAETEPGKKNKSWCGNVWKTIVHLRATRPDLDVCVLDCDYGLGIVRKGKPENRLNLDPEAIGALSYADLERDRTRLLNLREPSYLDKIVYALRA